MLETQIDWIEMHLNFSGQFILKIAVKDNFNYTTKSFFFSFSYFAKLFGRFN